jgi:hypothetical protein
LRTAFAAGVLGGMIGLGGADSGNARLAIALALGSITGTVLRRLLLRVVP